MTGVSRTTLVRRITVIAVHGTTVMVRQVTMTLHAVVVHRTTPPPEKSTPPPEKRKRRHSALLISAISVLLAAAAGIIIAVFALHHSPQENGYTYASVSPNGKFMVSANITSPGGDNEKIYIWNLATHRIVATLNDDKIYGIAISPDSKMIAVAHFFAGTSLWDSATMRIITVLNDPNSSNAGCLAFSPDSKTLAICDGDGYPKLYIWDIPRRSETTLSLPHEHFSAYPTDAAFAPNGQTLAVSMSINDPNYNPSFAVDQPGVEFWNIRTLRLKSSLPTSTASAGEVIYSHDGRTLITGSTLWDIAANLPLRPITLPGTGTSAYPPPASPSGDIAFSPNDKIMAVASGDNTLMWDMTTSSEIGTLRDQPSSLGVACVAFTPDGKTLVTAEGNGKIYLWNVATRRLVATLTNPSS